MNHQSLSNFIWSVADLLRGDYKQSEYDRVILPVPTLDEQKLIAERMSESLAGYDGLTAEANSAITLLQERRAALISAAVTGKIDVREIASETAKLATA